MTDQLQPKSLVEKLFSVMAVVDTIEKRGKNDAQGFNYVKAVDVARSVREAMLNFGIAFSFSTDKVSNVPFTTSRGGQMIFTTAEGIATFRDISSGDFTEVRWAGTGFDSGDKGLYKAITGGLKYALRMNFLIPDEADPENEKEQVSAALAAQPHVVGASAATLAAPAEDRTGPKLLTDRQKSHLRAEAREKGLDGDNFRAFVSGVTGKGSSKDMEVKDYERALAALKDPDQVAFYGTMKKVESAAS